MRAKVDAAKLKDPKFTYQGDKVHPNPAGHWVMAQSLISYFGDPESAGLESADKLLSPARYSAVSGRMILYQKAIHAETNPKRPGIPKGGTLQSAAEEAAKLEPVIYTING